MAKRTYIGKIEGKKLVLHPSRRAQMEADIAKMKDAALVVVEIRYAGKRSLQNSAYYWGVIVELISREFMSRGYNDMDANFTHEFLKTNFNSTQLVSEQGEFLGTMPGSTAEMNTEEFMIYREKIVRWAAESLDLYIPEPNEQTTLNL